MEYGDDEEFEMVANSCRDAGNDQQSTSTTYARQFAMKTIILDRESKPILRSFGSRK